MEEFKAYTGTPDDIVKRLVEEISDIFQERGLRPDGVHVLALFSFAVSCWKVGIAKPRAELGNMPSFPTMLSILTRTFTDSEFSEEESKVYLDDFVKMIESLGGRKVDANNSLASRSQGPLVMAPTSGIVH